MPELRFDTVVVRFGGEIGIKAEWTRKLYERRLITNIKAVLKQYGISYIAFVRKFGRLYIKTTKAEETAEKLKRVVGVSSLSPAIETTSHLNDVLNLSTRLVAQRFKKGRTFAVRCHRIGTHPYTSQEVCRQVGHKIQTELPQLKLKVNLASPEQVIHVEVREDKAYLFTDILKGAGGLPLGTQPKLICLLKDDLSSAVACWMTMKRGCPSILLHFKESEPSNKPSLKKVMDNAKMLMEWSVGFPRKLYVVGTREHLHQLVQKRPSDVKSLLSKRFMLKVAEGLAKMKNAEGIVTGDTIQDETAQKLHAFRIQDQAAKDYPTYRPLVGLDTTEIEELAQTIGLNKKNIRKTKLKAEKKQPPRARIQLDDIKQIEKELNIERTVEEALRTHTVIEV